MKENLDEAQEAVDLATEMLKSCEKRKILPQVAYAAFGNAFTRLHRGLGKGKEEFLEVAKIMGDLIDLPPD